MARVWPSALATAGVALALSAGGCADGERLDVGPLDSGGTFATGGSAFGGSGGSHAGAEAGDAGSGDRAGEGSGASGGDAASGGSSASGGRGGSGTRGGAGGSANGGNTEAGGAETGGSAGAGEMGGVGGEAGDGSGPAGSGGTGGSAPKQLSVCIRVDDPTALSFDTTTDFEAAVILDCRINWVTSLYYNSATGLNDRADFLNLLLHFNLDLWGCTGRSAPDSFDLIYAPAPLSAADAGALIDAYVAVATTRLTLSPGEITDLRALLGHLSEPLLLDPDPGDFSASSCTEAGGAGGEGGTG